MSISNYHNIIIGGGASGLYCASIAASLKKSTLIMEKNNNCGKKILISGGGKCNFTNLNFDYDNFVSQNKNFFKSVLNQYPKDEFLNLVKKYKIDFYEKTLGQLFCKTSSNEILSLLLEEVKKRNVEILTSTHIESIDRFGDDNDGEEFFIKTNKGDFKAKNLVIATGGLSFPKLGSTPFGHEIAKKFGHKVTNLRPALVGIKVKGFETLQGVSLLAEVKIGKNTFLENILFTHNGLSGPSILKASLYLEDGEKIVVNFMPGFDQDKIRSCTQNLKSIIDKSLPKSFLDYLNNVLDINLDKNLCEFSHKKITEIKNLLFKREIDSTITNGFLRAEVTRGGVCTKQIESKTLESKLKKNLYFIGEVLDVTGQLGGHNFQWAWASGHVVGNGIK